MRVEPVYYDAFDGAASSSSAAEFGTRGIVITAHKPRRDDAHPADAPAHLPSVHAVLDVPGSACATLTPLIKTTLRELAPGWVLEVRSDDPAARQGVPAWSRLTGTELLAMVEDDAQRTRFYLRKG